MTEQEENELICERLLRWPSLPLASEHARQQWLPAGSAKPEYTPTFATALDGGGVLLEALARIGQDPGFVKDPHARGYACSLESLPVDFLQPYRSIWTALRAAALEYIREAQAP